MSVFRARWRAGTLTMARFATAVEDLTSFPADRYPTGPFMRRALELRDNVTVYDSVYVALAEQLDCTLLTAARRLANAPGIRCRTTVVAVHTPRR